MLKLLICFVFINDLIACQATARYTIKSDLPKIKQESTVATETTIERSVVNSQEGIASYYAEAFHGKRTANGEIYDMNAMTAASVSLALGSNVKVTNLENGKQVVVRINDRMPKNSKGRIIDLSLKAAKELDLIRMGLAKVKVEVLK